MDSHLSLYETMNQISDRMVLAAQDNDWDALCELEKESAKLRDRLVAEDPPRPRPTLDDATRARKRVLIRKLLSDDREIRSHAEPWMENVKNLLMGNARQRTVQNAYGVGPR